MVNSISFENFKGIDKLKIDDFDKINIFVGRNETGKSTILEALALCLSVGTDYKDNLGKDILSDYFLNKYSTFQNLIQIGKKQSSISIDDNSIVFEVYHEEKGIGGNGHINEKILKGIDQIGLELAIRQLSRNRINHRKSESELSNTEHIEDLKQQYIDLMLNEEAMIFKGSFEGSQVNIKISFKVPASNLIRYQKKISDFADRFNERYYRTEDLFTEYSPEQQMIFYSSERNIKFEKLHDIAVNQKSISIILDKIKNEIDYFQDLRVSEDRFVVLTKDSEKAIPLEVRGDGLKSFIYMMFIENIINDGSVILEEPENFLHPGLMEPWCKDVISKSSNNQYFISTHSCELLEYLLENEEIRKKLKIFKMFKDPVDYEMIDGEEAYERMFDLKEDLRGI